MTGYVRTDTVNNIADGNVISAADLDGEFNGVQAAFNSSTGHTHDGTASEGAPITKLGPVQDVTISATVLGVKTTNTVDLGTSSLKFKDFYLAGTASIGGATTLSAALTYGGVTLNNAVTGTGNMVLSAGPTLTGTLTAATITASGTVTGNGNWVLGNADTDTITVGAAFVSGSVLRSAKTATNTLALAAYDVDGAAYTSLITLTASNTPTLALTSTGVGTINNMSIGATTASTGAFTTLSASSTVTLSGGTANGVAYLDGSKVLTTGSALVFDGTNLGVGSGLPSSGIYSASFSGLQVRSATSAAMWGSDYASNLTVNAYPTAVSNVYTRGGTSYKPSKFSAFDGAFIFSNAAAAGTTITWSDLMTLDASGNLGIGTTSPSGRLDVQNNQNATSNFYFRNTDTTNTSSRAALNVIAGSQSFGFLAINADNTFIQRTSGSLQFQLAGSTQATLDSSGNLGVGYTSPRSVSNYRTLALGGVSNGGLLDMVNASGSVLGTWYSDSSGSLSINADPNGAFASSNILFQVDGSERARIDSSGNLGLGVTPSNTSSSYRTIQIKSLNATTILTSDYSSQYATNAYWDGSAWQRGGNDYAPVLYNQFNGAHTFSNAAAAGTSITWTTLAILNSDMLYAYVGVNPSSNGAANARIFNSSSGSGTVTLYVGNQTITTSSDVRLKENIVDTQRNALELLNQLRVVDHTWNDPSDQCENNRNSRGTWMGLIAQEAQPVIPWLVNKPTADVDENGDPQYWHMDYGYSVPLLVKAIQEQQALITQLTARITALEGA
jgi:hypothetical protein